MHRNRTIAIVQFVAAIVAAAIAGECSASDRGLAEGSALQTLAKAARLQPNPWPSTLAIARTLPDVPADLCTVFSGEDVQWGQVWYGLEDDHGWPLLTWNVHSLRIGGGPEKLLSRLRDRIEKLGYRATSVTTRHDFAFHRRTADADFLLLLIKPGNALARDASEIDEICLMIRSTSRWSLPAYSQVRNDIPCFGPSKEAEKAFPPSVFKTLDAWPVSSLVVGDMDAIEIGVPRLSEEAMRERHLNTLDLLDAIPKACLAMGYKREELPGRHLRDQIVLSTFDPKAQHGDRDQSWLTVESGNGLAHVTIRMRIGYSFP